jgi:hypothetical protein
VSGHRIIEQASAELPAAEAMINREAPEQGCRNPRIVGELFSQRGREVAQGNAGRGKRVIAANGRIEQVNCDKAGGKAAPHILPHLVMEITIERFDAAGKRRPVMIRAKRLNAIAVGRRHFGWTVSR